MKNRSKILSEFRNSIRCGTGKAYLLQKKHPQINFVNEIYKASITNYAYDGQSEGDRSEYLIQFIKNLNQSHRKALKKKLVDRLFKEKEDTWDLQQIFNVCGFFAKKDFVVKKAIYKRFKQTPIPDSDWLGTSIILSLDGVKGMIEIANHLGERLRKGDDDYQDDWIVQSFDEENPQEKIVKILNREAKTNLNIKTYLKNINETRKRWSKNKRPKTKWTIEKIIKSLKDDKQRSPMFYVIEKLTKDEVKQIAKLLNQKSSKKTISKILSVFTLVKYPYSIKDLQDYMNKRYSSTIREYAYEAMSFFSDSNIRNLAIEKLEKTRKAPAKHLDILKSNYRQGDSKLITRTIERFSDEHIIEQIAVSLCDIYDKNKTIDCKKPLIALYGKMNCAIHRNSVLEILYKNKVLPNSIFREMQYDCDEGTRELYKKIKKKAGNIR